MFYKKMKIIACIPLVLYLTNSWANTNNPWAVYKKGPTCPSSLPDELSCQPIGVGDFKGYIQVSNVQFDTENFQKIKKDVFDQKTIDDEIEKEYEKIQKHLEDINKLKKDCPAEEFRGKKYSPYKIIGKGCLPKDRYCKLITSGRYTGYFIKSNVPNPKGISEIPTEEEVAGLRVANAVYEDILARKNQIARETIKQLRELSPLREDSGKITKKQCKLQGRKKDKESGEWDDDDVGPGTGQR